jgi:hypothetical protein
MQSQSVNNLQQNVSGELQPNRSDLQAGRGSDNFFSEGSFSQESLPTGAGKLRVESSALSSSVKSYSKSNQSEVTLTPFVMAASVVLLFIIMLAVLAVRASSRNSSLAVKPDLQQPIPDLPRAAKKKTKRTARKKRRNS